MLYFECIVSILPCILIVLVLVGVNGDRLVCVFDDVVFMVCVNVR